MRELTQESWVSVAQRKALIAGDAKRRQQVEPLVQERLEAGGRRVGWMKQVVNLLTGRTQSGHWTQERNTIISCNKRCYMKLIINNNQGCCTCNQQWCHSVLEYTSASQQQSEEVKLEVSKIKRCSTALKFLFETQRSCSAVRLIRTKKETQMVVSFSLLNLKGLDKKSCNHQVMWTDR